MAGPDTLTAALQASLELHAQRPAARCHGRTLSYAELEAHSRALAAYWQHRGLVPGDRLALMLPGGLPLPVAALSAWRAGLVLVPLDPRLDAASLRHQLQDCGAKALLASPGAFAALEPVLDALPDLWVVRVGEAELLGPLRAALLRHRQRAPRTATTLPGSVAFSAALDRGRSLDLTEVPARPDDIAALLYTGGTTGTARGVVLLQRNLLANLRQAEAWLQPALQARAHDEAWVTVAALPLHHVFGFTLAMLFTLVRGGCLLLVPDLTDTDALVALLQRERFHLFPSLNPVFEAVARHAGADRVDWSGLRLSLSGGMAVDPATAMLWLLKTGSPIIQGYGLSEASPAVTCNRVDDTLFSGHLGHPLLDTELRLVGDDGEPVPPGSSGEIAVRGPQVMAGYWQRPDETAAVMLPGGFLRTGDIGRFNDDGTLVLVDRKRDYVWVGGLPVVPNEVEEVVMRARGVRECAAVGVPDGEAGEVVKLVVVRSEPEADEPSEAELRAHCERHLAGYQRPVHLEFRTALPRCNLGKVLRRALRA